MAGRSIRTACLALATWAVLFAPGAAADDAVERTERVPPDQVAAAIVAPTFGSDGVVTARSCRDDGLRQDCGPAVGDVPSATVVLRPDGVPSISAGNERFGGDAGAQRRAPARAPPTD